MKSKSLKPHLHPQPLSEWTVVLWIGAFFMAIFGFSGLAGTASWIVQVLSVVFAILFLFASVIFRSTPPL